MEMLATAQVDLGLSERRFWSLTPAQYAALQRVRLNQIFRRNYRAGIIVATIRAALGDQEAKPMDSFERSKAAAEREAIEAADSALRRQMNREARERKGRV
jgi:hypothetical protein